MPGMGEPTLWVGSRWARERLKRPRRVGHYPKWPERACTKVQVFHREYRENEAKREAKVSG